MKRKILTVILIGSLFLMALTGCANFSYRNPAKADSTTRSNKETKEETERPDDSAERSKEEAEKEVEKEIAQEPEKETEEIENPAVGKAGLYQSDGSFIPWDELGLYPIDFDFSHEDYRYKDKEEIPGNHRVFSDNNYSGDLIIPESTEYIGERAFWWCDSLTSIDLSDTEITWIGQWAFYHCTSLTSVDASNTQTTGIEEWAFYECTSLTSIDLPDTLAVIRKNAFEYCESLTSIDLSNTQIKVLDYAVFAGCTSLTSIDLPNTLTKISHGALSRCTALTNINYAGTMEEWNAIEKYTDPHGGNWNYESAIETITCSDGVITL